MSVKKRGLGRGLNSLISQSSTPVSLAAEQEWQDAPKSNRSSQQNLRFLPIEQLCPGQFQPRKSMAPEALEELASSIAKHGIMQPVVVRPLAADRFEIIAGERRWRAAQQAGLDRIPALVREVSDEDCLALGLIENIQREDLNALEEASALWRLQQEFELTQQQVADAVGRSRVAVANLLRLLNLAPGVQKLLQDGHLDQGHAKALLALPESQQLALASEVASKQLSVRQTEQRVRQLSQPKPDHDSSPNPDLQRLEQLLAERLGAPVQIKHSAKGKGQLTVRYSSLEELDGILGRMASKQLLNADLE